MQQSPSGEADRSSASQEIPCIFMETWASLLWSWEAATFPYPEPDQSIPCPSPIQLLEEPL